MKIDLNKIKIRYPEKPFIDRDFRKDYKVFGFLGDDLVGHITVSLLDNAVSEKNDFWFEKRKRIWVPRPVAVYQETEHDFRGQDVSGKLLVLVNEDVKIKYQMPLASSTTFCLNSTDWKVRGFVERPAKRVWEKLEAEGLAYRRDYQSNTRWVMK